jgi:hypothetical protein
MGLGGDIYNKLRAEVTERNGRGFSVIDWEKMRSKKEID